ncbi:MAG: FAD-dependent oxidoreductase [Burkholderiales bacterium]|nr:FAD-dependent oxidoreductase [Burkholderiales bacterium]
MMRCESYDVVVVGAGAAGVTAAAAAARGGAKTLLVEAGPIPGGELLSGMAVDGALNARGEWIVGGVARELFAELEKLGGYIGPLSDWRLIWYVCVDPELMKLAVLRLLGRYKVNLLLHTVALETIHVDGKVDGLVLLNKSGRCVVRAPVFIDCSGDGDLAVSAGARYDMGSPKGEYQPVSIMFRMAGIEKGPLFSFLRAHPEHFALGESEAIRGGRTDAQIAAEVERQGEPCFFLKADGPLLGEAIDSGEMYPTALVMVQPTSRSRREVCLNTTRVANIDATRTHALSGALSELAGQVTQCAAFMRRRVPGFEKAEFSGLAPRVGIRETRRIVGEYRLSGEEVLRARKSEAAVAKGSHHVDIHQDGAKQVRIPVDGGGSYDIPWGCLVPKGLKNVLMAGRCFSADREAHGSARVMGPCMGMGHAVGAAASIIADEGIEDVRWLPVSTVRERLRSEGAVLDGVH